MAITNIVVFFTEQARTQWNLNTTIPTIPTNLINFPLHIQNNILSYSEPKKDYFIRRLTCSTFRDLIKGGETETTGTYMIESIQMFKWSLCNGYKLNKKICENASIGGHLEVLKWARENGCSWNENTCYNAALSGHFNVLKWARQNGCPWNKWVCEGAARGGHLDVLKWARQNGCSWDAWTCRAAFNNDYIDILKWARQNGCPEIN
jgi:hypothetical protein